MKVSRPEGVLIHLLFLIIKLIRILNEDLNKELLLYLGNFLSGLESPAAFQAALDITM